MKESVRYLLKKGKKPRVIGVLSDQTPSANELNHWINFLNQKTPVFLGTEKLAKKMDCPVFFAHIIYCDGVIIFSCSIYSRRKNTFICNQSQANHYKF